MSDIVLVHGIAQERLSADSLEESWLPALAGGVRIAGFADVADRIGRRPAAPAPLDTRMAFYGNLFRQPDAQGADAEVPADSAELAEQIGYQWLLAAAARATDTKSRSVAVEGAVEIGGQAALAALDSGTGWEMQGKGAVLRNVINAVARIPWFGPQGFALAERFVARSLAQVTGYLTDEDVRAKALAAVADLLDKDTKVLIGHSLGSVVAFEAAHLASRPIPLLVTIGSPLGLEPFVYSRLRPQPPTFPGPVGRWVNVADREDYIAAVPDLGPLFVPSAPEGARFENAYTHNGAKPHTAIPYLTGPTVGRVVGETLSSAA